jgi:O-antigen ligase
VKADRSRQVRAILLVALLAWPLAAFGGRSAATASTFGVVCLALAAVRRPHLGGSVDRAIGALLALVAAQLAPLPVSLVDLLSPHASELTSALAIQAGAESRLRPLTISRADTAWAWMVMAGAAAMFWLARSQFRRGGVRLTTRLIAALGFAVALLAIAQAATAGRDIYWRFRTEFEGPLPFGPFVNRNHFATWVIMALPLTLGYVAARSGRPAADTTHVSARSRLASAIDPRTAWLLAAAVTMVVALLLSLSRSGMLALGTSACGTAFLCWQRLDRRRRTRLLLAAAIVVVGGLAWADIPALGQRVAGAQSGVANRMTIWRETLPIVGDFWLTGTGAGTYQRAMYAYQQSSRAVYFNQAHNHYLQVAAEGGAILVMAVLAAAAVFLRTARGSLTHDDSGLFWIRAGAGCGLAAVALQSVWETGLVMPANAALAAVLAALVVYDRDAA